ncbi:MAG TPA: hypothetical protein VGD77_06230 [Gemmatimonadaceae bacterium]
MIPRRVALALGALLAATGCLKISEPGSGVFTLSELKLPWPSVVVNDTLRDSTGRAAPLRVIGVTAAGDTVDDAPTWVVLDRGLHVTAQGFVIGDSIRSGARLVGQVGGLQSPVATLLVVPAPVLARAEPATIAPVTWKRALGDTSHVASPGLGVRVLGGGDPAPGVGGWIVSYTILSQPAPVGDSPAAYLGDGVNRRTATDTTDASGLASRVVVLRPVAASTTGADTVVVQATVRYRGSDVPGSPVLFTVPFRRQ